ncbi:unnamed protein product [Calypogeia fissa]
MAPKAQAKSKPAPSPSPQQQSSGKGGGTDKTAAAAAGGAPASAPAGPSIEELFKTLEKHVKAEDFKQIIKVSDQILKLSPGDKDAIECKVVACIELDEYDQALVVIDSAPGIDLAFQQAYCLYKRNRGQEALASLKTVQRDAKVLQLEAQILFKLGDFASCVSTYQELLQNHEVHSDEVKSNIIAAYVSGGRSREVQAVMDSMKASARNDFNLAYNAGCSLIERGELSKAEEHLLLARRIGQEKLIEENFPEEEIEDELAPISVQLSYVHQIAGNSAEALEGYNTLIKKKPADESSMAVASNNLIALRGARDLFDALKKFDKLFEKKTGGQRVQFTEKLEQRLSARQKEVISFNRFLLLLHSNKLDQARDLLPSLLDSFPDSEIPPILAASLAVKEGKPARAEDVLEQFAAQHPKNSTEAYLVRAQVSISSGHFARAAESLEKITELQHRPGMVATLVALRERAGDIEKAEAILDAAVNWWDNRMGDDDTTLEELIQEAATFKLKNNKLEAAAKLFQRLTKSSSPAVRAEALNGLVRSTALSDPAKAELYEKELPPLPGLKGIDVEALERAAPTSKRVRGTDEELKAGEDRVEKIKPKKKRKRKPLYPKNFDPANPGPPPDPERWLPKRERSSFKPKKKDKRAQHQQIRGAQGSISRDKAGDASGNGPSHVSSGPSKPGISSASSAKPAAPAEPPKASSSNQKNKKKGRR